MYKVIPDFISDDEQVFLKELVAQYIAKSSGKLRSYADHEQHHNATFGRNTEPIYFFSIVEELKTNTKLQEIVSRMQKAVGVPEENPNTYFNWVISIAPRNTEVMNHVDPLDEKLMATKKIVRINLIVENAKRGGIFQLSKESNAMNYVDADIPNKGLMTFDASDIWHRITKNLSGTTRINLSIDAVVNR
ncbi:hypothetical protein [Brevundimonas sp.]|jgi:hypothetical protein|uniref:hypothetical protein n=1 Tax=Brevundimonas sp. TaxID=1871086 RepID=UPI003782DED9